MDKRDGLATKANGNPVPKEYDPTDDDIVDLHSGDYFGGGGVMLECTNCPGGNDEAPGGAKTHPVRK